MAKRSVQPNLFSFLPSKISDIHTNKVKRSRVDENEEPDDSSSSRNPSSVLKRPLDQHHLGCINLGQSVLIPYQLSASSYATACGDVMDG